MKGKCRSCGDEARDTAEEAAVAGGRSSADHCARATGGARRRAEASEPRLTLPRVSDEELRKLEAAATEESPAVVAWLNGLIRSGHLASGLDSRLGALEARIAPSGPASISMERLFDLSITIDVRPEDGQEAAMRLACGGNKICLWPDCYAKGLRAVVYARRSAENRSHRLCFLGCHAHAKEAFLTALGSPAVSKDRGVATYETGQ